MRAATRREVPSTASDADDPLLKKPPKFCPWCGGGIVKRWAPNKLRWLAQRISARCSFVCLKCEIAVRAFKFPTEPVFTTKSEALAEASRAHDDLEASGFWSVHAWELYQQGKCTCPKPPYANYVRSEPCPVHTPLSKTSKKRRSRS